MTKEEIEILENVLSMHREICYYLHIECALDRTSIEDTLIRLKSGEYIIRNNPDW